MTSLPTSVIEKVPVGDPSILNSPHVSEGPGRIAKAPVPSVYVDDRGDIHRLRVGGRRLNVLSTKAESMRSGYLHPHNLYSMVLAGSVEVWTLNEEGTHKQIYHQFEHYVVSPYVPHILYFVTDSIIVEWWDKNTDFSCYYYHPYRKLIDVQNSLIHQVSRLGHHQFLVPQDDASLEKGSRSSRSFSFIVAWTTAGLFAGIGIGAVLATATAKRHR